MDVQNPKKKYHDWFDSPTWWNMQKKLTGAEIKREIENCPRKPAYFGNK